MLVHTKAEENIENLKWVLSEQVRFFDTLSNHLTDSLKIMEVIDLVDGLKSSDVKSITPSTGFFKP